MNSANIDKTVFVEKTSLHVTYPPTSSNPANEDPQLRREDRSRRAIMSRFKHLLFVLFALSLLAITLVGASTSNTRVSSAETQQFRELLDTLDATTLHETLHEHFKDKYQHGVYREDKSALEALHKQNAAVAQSLVQLVKRQGPEAPNNTSVVTTTAVTETTISVTTTITSTTTSAPPPVEPTPTPTPTTTPPVVNPPPTSSSTSAVPNPPSSTTSAPLSTPVPSSSSSVASTSVPSTLSSMTSARPTTTSTTSAPPVSSRTAAAEEDVTTSVVYTTTLADGAAVVTTQYTVVPAPQPTGTGGSPTNTANASLQTGLASSQHQIGGWIAGLGFLGVAVAWGL